MVPAATTDGDTAWHMETGRIEPESYPQSDDQSKTSYQHLYPWDTHVGEELRIPLQAMQVVSQEQTPIPHSMQISQWHEVWLLGRMGGADLN